ncbi:hypothetical protein QMG40_11785 [Arthrobacter sp. H35-MC1]|nr:hypothetical protein [Arthrobacter sp. H35-MC1]
MNRRQTTPQDLWDEFDSGELKPDFAKRVLGQYFNERWPCWNLSRNKWITMFTYAKEHYDGDDVRFQPLPEAPEGRQLYRGAPNQSRRGVSWTTSLHVARMFAGSSQYNFNSGASIWTVQMTPEMFLAQPRLIEGEMEVLVDIGDVQPAKYESAAQVWKWFTTDPMV